MTGLENLIVRVYDNVKKISKDYTLLELVILLADELETRANDETKNASPVDIVNPGNAHVTRIPPKERM
jgi:hypothetical protein